MIDGHVFQQTVNIHMGPMNCAPLLTDLFLYSDEQTACRGFSGKTKRNKPILLVLQYR